MSSKEASPNLPPIPAPGDEYIWFIDFENRSVSCAIAAAGIKRYGELANLEEVDFMAMGLIPDELKFVRTLLEKRPWLNSPLVEAETSAQIIELPVSQPPQPMPIILEAIAN